MPKKPKSSNAKAITKGEYEKTEKAASRSKVAGERLTEKQVEALLNELKPKRKSPKRK